MVGARGGIYPESMKPWEWWKLLEFLDYQQNYRELFLIH